MKAKQSVTVRLSAETVSELKSLTKRHDLSQAQVISILIHAFNVGADYEEVEKWFEIARMG